MCYVDYLRKTTRALKFQTVVKGSRLIQLQKKYNPIKLPLQYPHHRSEKRISSWPLSLVSQRKSDGHGAHEVQNQTGKLAALSFNLLGFI
jgi:hypothetical protein